MLYCGASLQIFELEKGDGVGETADIILQTFLRFACLAAFPIVCCTPIIYLMVSVLARFMICENRASVLHEQSHAIPT